MSLIRAVILASQESGAQPSQAFSMIWAKDDNGSDNRKTIEQYLVKSTVTFLQKLVSEKKTLLESCGYVPSTLSEGVAPTYDERAFSLCMPQSLDNKLFLPLRQDKIEEVSFTRCQNAWQETLKEHNSKWNPSGIAYNPKKRKAEGDSNSQSKSLKLDASEMQLKDLSGPVVSFNVENQSDVCVHIDREFQLWVMSTSDCTLGVNTPLMLAYGEYRTGSEVAQRKDKGATLCDLKLDGDSEAFFYHDEHPKLKPVFEPNVSKFKDFLNYLEVKGIVNPDFVAHTVTALREKEGEYEIKATEECAFEMKKLPNNQTATHQNALSLFDWQSLGDMVTVRMRLKYIESKTATGIFPQKPGLFVTKPVSIQAGKLYQLIKKKSAPTTS